MPEASWWQRQQSKNSAVEPAPATPTAEWGHISPSSSPPPTRNHAQPRSQEWTAADWVRHCQMLEAKLASASAERNFAVSQYNRAVGAMKSQAEQLDSDAQQNTQLKADLEAALGNDEEEKAARKKHQGHIRLEQQELTEALTLATEQLSLVTEQKQTLERNKNLLGNQLDELTREGAIMQQQKLHTAESLALMTNQLSVATEQLNLVTEQKQTLEIKLGDSIEESTNANQRYLHTADSLARVKEQLSVQELALIDQVSSTHS